MGADLGCIPREFISASKEPSEGSVVSVSGSANPGTVMVKDEGICGLDDSSGKEAVRSPNS